jgi:hypothetical protein
MKGLGLDTGELTPEEIEQARKDLEETLKKRLKEMGYEIEPASTSEVSAYLRPDDTLALDEVGNTDAYLTPEGTLETISEDYDYEMEG